MINQSSIIVCLASRALKKSSLEDLCFLCSFEIPKKKKNRIDRFVGNLTSVCLTNFKKFKNLQPKCDLILDSRNESNSNLKILENPRWDEFGQRNSLLFSLFPSLDHVVLDIFFFLKHFFKRIHSFISILFRYSFVEVNFVLCLAQIFVSISNPFFFYELPWRFFFLQKFMNSIFFPPSDDIRIYSSMVCYCPSITDTLSVVTFFLSLSRPFADFLSFLEKLFLFSLLSIHPFIYSFWWLRL